MIVLQELAILLVIATVVAAVVRLLKQPVIIGHILTGVLVGPLFFNLIKEKEFLEALSTLGIAFLLFIVGINLTPRVIKEVGRASIITGLGQIIFTSLVGFFLAKGLGFSPLSSLYIATALTFSSTIIIMKLLSDKLALEKLYGKISIGFLIIQDVVAVLILILVSAFTQGANITQVFLEISFKGILIAFLLILLAKLILPKLSNFFARQQELLFLFSLAWGLGLATLFNLLGFSLEIGALAAGVALATSPYSIEISARLKPLRDFFVVLFFVLLGAQMMITQLGSFLLPVIVLSLFILLGNPLIVIIIMIFLGYSKRTSFLAGLTVAQISEFSLVLILLGERLGHLSSEILSIVTAVGLVTIAGSTYLIIYAEKIYPKILPWLKFVDKLHLATGSKKSPPIKDYDALLFGLNRIGYDFLKVFKELDLKFLVIDFNPEVSRELERQKVAYCYGDAEDSEFLDTLPLEKVKLIVSTIPDFSANVLLLTKVRKINKSAVVIVLSHAIKEALELYKRGASYVVLPHFLGGQFAAEMIRRLGVRGELYKKEQLSHLENLEERLARGHEHPLPEKKR